MPPYTPPFPYAFSGNPGFEKRPHNAEDYYGFQPSAGPTLVSDKQVEDAPDRADLAIRLQRAQLQERVDKARLSAGELDQSTGAPPKVRMLVDSARSPQDQLATLKKFFPDARHFVEGNFLFTHPETGKETLYNPGGLEFGDIAGSARVGAGMVGGTLGGAAGVPAGPAGVLTGVGLGTAGAEAGFDVLAR